MQWMSSCSWSSENSTPEGNPVGLPHPSQKLYPVGIQFDEDEQQDGEGP